MEMSSDEISAENINDSVQIENAIAENTHLRELVQQLEKRNQETQRQFDAVIETMQQSELLSKENVQLKAQINQLKAQKDELSQRLKISEQTKEDLSNKVKASLADSEREHQEEVQQLQAQILSLQNQNRIEAEKLRMKMQMSDDQALKSQADNAVMKSQIGKLLKLSSNYFHKTFDDLKQLTDHLMHPKVDEIESIKASMNENAQDKEKLKRLKEAFDEEKSKCKQLELEVIQLRQTLQTESSKFASQVNQFQDKERKLQNTINQLQNDHKQEIVTLQNKMNSRKYHTMMTQTNNVDFGSIERLSDANKEIDRLNSKLIEAQNTIAHQQSKIDSYAAQSTDDNNVKEKLREKAQKAIAKNEKMLKDMKEDEKRINALIEKLGECNDEKAQLESRIAVMKAENSDIQNQYDLVSKELSNTKRAIDLIERQLFAQIAEVKQITNDRDYLLTLVHNQNQALQKTESIIENIKKQVPKQSIFGPNSPSTSSNAQEISNDWEFGTLPEDLKSILRGIAENDGFSVEKRIAQIFNVVSRWFDNKESESAKEIKELKEKIEKSGQALSDFATSILNAIDQDSLDIEEIVEAISNLYKEKLGLQQKVNELEAKPVVCDKATFDEMTETIESLQDIIKVQRNKLKQRKAELKECKETFISVKDKTDEELQTLRDSHDKARQTIDSLQEQLDELHQRNKELLDELTETKDSHINEYSQAQSEIEAIMMEHSTKLEEMKAESDRQLQARDNKLLSLQNKVQEYENSIKKWEEMSRDANDEVRNLKSQINKLNMEKDEQFEKMVHQKEKEARQIENKYQSMIEQLKIKSSETEAIVQNMTKDIEENEQKMKMMTQQMTEMQFKLQKADLKAQSQLDSVERTKKLAIAQLKAKLMAAETNYSLKFDEQKHQWEAEKRNLFGYFAQQFGAFFDAKQALNEDSFKQVVAKIKNEMERHIKQEKTIRRLLKAKESQSTEDALADLVLYMHPQLQKNSKF